jgi:hypothetical protein
MSLMMSLSHRSFEKYNKKSKEISTGLEFFVHCTCTLGLFDRNTRPCARLMWYVLHCMNILIQDIYGTHAHSLFPLSQFSDLILSL